MKKLIIIKLSELLKLYEGFFERKTFSSREECLFTEEFLNKRYADEKKMKKKSKKNEKNFILKNFSFRNLQIKKFVIFLLLKILKLISFRFV